MRNIKSVRLLSTLLVLAGLMFLLYERYLLETKNSWIYYLDMVCFSLIIVVLTFNLNSNYKGVSILEIISLIIGYMLLKFAYVVTVPSSVLSIYPDAYAEYQVASSIEQFGHIQQMSYYTSSARALSTMPIVPILSYHLSSVLSIPLSTVLKYLGASITSFLVPLSYVLLFKSIHEGHVRYLVSTILVMFSPWVLGFPVWGHYAMISIVFVPIILWCIQVMGDQNDKRVGIFYIVLLLALTFTHMYMAVVILLAFTVYIVFILVTGKKSLFHRITIAYILYLIVTVVYLVYLSGQFSDLVFMVEYLKKALMIGSISKGIAYYGTPRASPVEVVVLKYIGLISLGILSVLSLLWYYLKSRAKIMTYLMFLSIGIAGGITILPYIFDPKYGTDLFNRIMYLGVLTVSPYIALFVDRILHSFDDNKKKFSLAILILFILLFGVLSAVRPDLTDWKTPIVMGEDIRLSWPEWASEGKFATNYLPRDIYGLRAGVGPVGLFGRKRYYQISPSVVNPKPIISPTDFGNIPNHLRDKYFVLRISMVKYTDVGFGVPGGEFIKFRSNPNTLIIYSCQDVFIVKT